MARGGKERGTKAKYVEPKWRYIRYATKLHGWHSCLALKGTKFWSIMWFNGAQYGVSVGKLGHEEAKYFETLGPVDQGVQSWAKYKRYMPWTKQAEAMMVKAEAYVKAGGV